MNIQWQVSMNAEFYYIAGALMVSAAIATAVPSMGLLAAGLFAILLAVAKVAP
jgi:hypothetical protein